MFENFKMDVPDEKIMGYFWEKNDPEFVVCLIHGIGEHAGRYDRMAIKMNESGMAVLSMDLRGHGISSGKRGHCAPRNAVLSDVDALMTQAKTRYPGIPVVLYGHSMGGNIVLDYRRRGTLKDHPSAYVASAPWIILERKISKGLLFTMEILSWIKPDFQIKAGIKNEDLGNLQTIEGQAHKELRHDFITAGTAVDGNRVGAQLTTIPVNGKKLLLMHGDADRICSIEGSRQFVAIGNDCEYKEWPGYYHEIHNGNPNEDGEKVIEYAIQWIKEKA